MTDPAALVLAVATAFVGALLLTRWLAAGGLRHHLLDHPNERSLHERPIPRGGGIAVLGGVAAGVAWLPASDWTMPHGAVATAAGVLLLAAVSLADDARPLPPLVRIAVHLAAGGGLLAGGVLPAALTLPGLVLPLPALAAAVFVVLFTVWMANLYNFMDGMDGFAGGMTVLGFGGLAALAAMGGSLELAAACAVVAAAAAGFLVFNFPPARIFMGDVGSVPLGFVAAALILVAERDGVFAWWQGVLVFSPFVVDATVTLARRLVRGERVWQAHRTHYYQRLVRAGLGHRRTVLWEYALMAACGLSAVAAGTLGEAAGTAIGAFWLVGYTALGLTLSRWIAAREGGRA